MELGELTLQIYIEFGERTKKFAGVYAPANLLIIDYESKI